MAASPLSSDSIVRQLHALLGERHVFSSANALARFIDEPRHRFHTAPVAAVQPSTREKLQELVRWASENKVPLVPQGGNTGLVGGQIPLTGHEIIVSLGRLNTIRSLDREAGFMVAEAGVTLQEVQERAAEEKLLFPLAIASQGSAQIGGVLSTNAGGVQVLAYGNARKLCMGIEAVLPDGALYQGLNGLKKNNTGYDLSNLFVGAEGTLGFITAASLSLFPQPEDHETAWINVASPAAALRLFRFMAERSGNTLTAFELMPRFGIEMQLKHKVIERDPAASLSPWYVLAEISRPRGGQEGLLAEGLEAAFEAELIADAVIARSLWERDFLWQVREHMSSTQSLEGASIKHDVSVPVSAVPELISRGIEAAEKIVPGIRPCPFGHLGDGNIHFNFTQPEGGDPAAYMAGAQPVHDAIHGIVFDLNGSFSAEHGVGQLKTDLLLAHKDPVALHLMARIKRTLDPNNIMNPGKVLAPQLLAETEPPAET
ncbi:MAG TPA: FAD-binding oxidoreductase [Devosia sp.]|nr:FAD-binding oxidoreductase [Devosia sp.]